MIDCKNGSRVLPFCPFTFCDAQQGTMLLQKNASMCFRHRRQYAAWRKTLRATAAPRRWKKVREILYKCIIIFYSNLRCAISTLDQVITLYLSIRDCYYTAAIACRGRLGYADTCEFKLSCWLRMCVQGRRVVRTGSSPPIQRSRLKRGATTSSRMVDG